MLPAEPVRFRTAEAFAPPEHTSVHVCADDISMGAPLRLLAALLLLGIVVAVAGMYYLPWIQVVGGAGTVTTADPSNRPQDLTAFTDGRIGKWFVVEGQRVEEGDPLVEIVDLDPDLVPQLDAELAAVRRRLDAAKVATAAAKSNFDRQERLLAQGLTSESNYEQAKIRFKEQRITEEEARAALSQTGVNVQRQSSLVVNAPRAGNVIGLTGGATSTLVQAGQRLATFVPETTDTIVELYMDGLDAALIAPGRRVRLEFEGWPAVQYGGWPARAIGTFGGIVDSVDPSVSTGGRFRVLVREDPEDPWPDRKFLRIGARTRGWVLLDQVKAGYEVWRRLNGFPPNLSTGPGAQATQ